MEGPASLQQPTEEADRTVEPRTPLTVSVVVLNYNYAGFVLHAVDSVLAQDHPDIDLVVIDDASTDGSVELLAGYGSAIRIIRHDRNRGQAAAINTGFAASRGDVVWFLDADDGLLPGACSVAAALFERNPDAAKLHAPLAIVDARGCGDGSTVPANPAVLADGDLRAHLFRFRNHGWPPMSGNVFRRRSLEAIMPVPEAVYPKAADSFLCEQAPITGPLVAHRRPLAVYRIHGTNQFANTPLTLEWLHTKLERERVSHAALNAAAARLAIPGGPEDPTVALDIALCGYRLASLRLDSVSHPSIGSRPDSRPRVLHQGLRSAWLDPRLALVERIKRSLWFSAASIAPQRFVQHVLDYWVPDGPHPPGWKRNRVLSASPVGEPLIGPSLPARRSTTNDMNAPEQTSAVETESSP